jgi:isoquinoline 1-oxidoreductase beta subunit
MNTVRNPSRRSFLKTGAVATGGLVIGFVIPAGRRLAMAQASAEATAAAGAAFAPNAFLRIAADDTVTVLLAHSEMGQGIWTTLPMLIAEELDADWATIRVEHAPAAPEYASLVFGMQGTGGSTTISSEFERYRRAGAAARAMLVQAAADRWQVPVGDISTRKGEAIAGERRLRYGELADAAGKLPVPDMAAVALKAPADWTVIGKPVKRLDGPDKITGRAQFGIDVQFEGLLTAVVARSPVFGGSVKSFDASAAEQVPGVRKVVQVPTGVAVVADHYWAAKLGRDALRIEWEPGDHAGLDSDTLRAQFTELLAQDGAVAGKAGDMDAAVPDGARRVEADYAVPYLAHAPMEPLNCTVRIETDSCELWLGTQFQTVDQMTAAGITGLRPDQVKVNTTFLGGAFGRRANPSPDVVFEAVHVAKAAGAPVKTVWSREDDVRGGFYRPAFMHRAAVDLDPDSGLPVRWKHTLVGQSIMSGTAFEAMMVRDGIDHSSVEGVADSPYLKSVPRHSVDLHSPRPGVPVLWWRSVGHSQNAFAMESLVDELALAAGQDPVAYRRLLLKDQPRHLAVLELAASKAGWNSAPAEGRARGVAVHASFGSVVAQVAEVSVADGRIRVHKVVCAVDCGIAVNPDGVVAQMESGIAFGLGAALYSTLTLREGRVQQGNFNDYRVLRMDEMPQVEVHIVPSTQPPSGVGEPGLPPIAPAVANAVARLTGKRLRELPLTFPA